MGSSKEKPKEFYEFGGPNFVIITTVITILIPFVFNLLISEPTLESALEKLFTKNLFNIQVLLILLAYIVFLVVLSVIRVGGEYHKGPDGFVYHLNNKLCLQITCLAIFGSKILGLWDALAFCRQYYYELMVWSLILSVAVSIWAFIRSFSVPEGLLGKHVSKNARFYDFFMGRELNPRFGHFDVYLWTVKYSLNTTVVFVLSYLEYGLQTGDLDFCVSHFIHCILSLVYIMDPIYDSSGFLTTFEIHSECYGFMVCFGYLMYPFIYATPFIYSALNKSHLPTLELFFIFFLASFALWGLFQSNTIKHRFRTDPNDPRVQHIKSMDTSLGKKLMISGPWGVVRHPNYSMDCIFQITLIAFTGYSMGSLFAAFSVILLLSRSARDAEHCSRKYGEDWTKFCSIVKYKLIPGIY